MDNNENRINDTSPRFKAPLEPIMEEDQTISSMAAEVSTAAIPAISTTTVPRRANPSLVSTRGITVSAQNLRPHIITINRGQDVVETIESFCKQQGHRGAAVLSAGGSAAISSVTLSGPDSPHEIMLEGRFAIMSLTGRLMKIENGSGSGSGNEDRVKQRLRLTVSLALQDMSIVGGVVTGPLVAAVTMKVLLGLYEPLESNTREDIIPSPTNLPIRWPSFHFDASASSSKSNKND